MQPSPPLDDSECIPIAVETTISDSSLVVELLGSTESSQDLQHGEETVVSISTAFFPGADHTPADQDLILMSADTVFFYVHSDKVISVSNNLFDHKWPQQIMNDQYPPMISVEDSSSVLNLLLHVLYNMSYNKYALNAQDVTGALDSLAKYGYSTHIFVHHSSELHNLMLDHAPTHAMDMYTAAACYRLEELAIAISPYTLSLELSELTDEMVEKMGAMYLRRLVFLHLGRIQALKRLLDSPPEFHRSTATCGLSVQRHLTRAWNLATAGILWEVRPDVSASRIQFVLGNLVDSLNCPVCKESAHRRISTLISAWANIKDTI